MIAVSLLERFVHGVGIASPPLHSRAFRNTINPSHQMWERFQILIREARKLPSLNPRPGTNIRNRVLPLAFTSKIFPRFTSVLARQSDLQHAIDPQCLVLEPLDGVFPDRVSIFRANDIRNSDLQGIFSFANLAKWFTCP